MFDSAYTNGIFARIRGVPDRSWLFFFTCAATVISVQLLYLVNDDLVLNLALSSFAILGFLFSYYLNPGYHRFVIVILDIAAISIFTYFITKVVNEYATWGTDLGVLLGILISLYSFRAFTEREHRMILAASLVILLLASVASYDVKLMFILPFFVFCSFSTLYVANNLNLAERISYLASEMGAGASVLHIAIRATVTVLAVSILIYMLVPHSATVRNPQFRLPTSSFVNTDEDADIPQQDRLEIDRTSDISGFSDKFDLSQGGRIEIRDQPVLLVRSTLNDYLRGRVFDVYDGMSWTQSDLADYKNAPALSDSDYKKIEKDFPSSGLMSNVTILPLVDFPSHAIQKQLEEKTIFVAENNTFSSQTADENTDLKYSVHHLEISFINNGLAKFFSPYQPYRIEDISSRVESGDTRYADPTIDAFSVLNATRGANEIQYFPKGFQYKLFVLKPSFLPAKLEEAPNNVPRKIREHYTQLPSTINADEPDRDPLVKLARTVAEGGKSNPDILPNDKVLNIYDYFVNSGEFTYSLDYPKMPTRKITRLDEKTGETVDVEVPEVDAAYHFVFQAKKGYCEYFANAFAVFCRINEIPARVVTGYAPGKYDFLRNGYVVSTMNAHAWVEVYFDGFGWVVFDPTPASSDFLSAGEIRTFLNATFDIVQNLFVIDPRGVQEAVMSFFALLFKRLYQVAVENSVTSTLILAGLFGFLFWSIWRRRPKREPPHIPKNAIVAAYYSIETTFATHGIHRPVHETGRVFLDRVSNTVKPLRTVLKPFIVVYYRFAYGEGIPGATDVASAQDAASQVAKYFEKQQKDEPN